MPLLEFVAKQLRRPSGLVGRVIVSRFLNRGNLPMNQLTLQLLAIQPHDRVLEVGFGGGDLINRMAPMLDGGCIAGVDFSPDMVEVSKKRLATLIQTGKVELRCASAESLPYEGEHFTKACTVNTIYFWPDPLVVLRELWRVLGSRARLVVCFNPRATLQKVPFTKYGFAFFEPDEVARLLESVGFVDVEMVPGSTGLGEFLCAVATK